MLFLSKQIRMKKSSKLLLLLVTALISSFFLLEVLGKSLNQQLFEYATFESERLIKNVINYSLNDLLSENLDSDLFTITKNDKGEIEILDYNTKEVNRILKEINKQIQNDLLQLEEGQINDFPIADTFKSGKFSKKKSGIICEVPLGSLRNNALYSNFGPSVPIRMNFIGSISSNLVTNITPYGYNSLVVEVNVSIEVDTKITLPTATKSTKINYQLPLSLKIIQGIIPQYYYEKGLEKSSSIYTTSHKDML